MGSKSTADTTDYEISATGVQVKVGHLVNTSDRMRFEALGVSMTLAVEAAVHLRENKSTLGGSDIILMFSINPDPLRIPNLFNFGPKNLRFHLDGAVIAETVVEVIPGPEDLLAEAYEFMDALTGEPVTNVGVTVVCNDVEEVLNSGDDHGVELPLNLPEGEAKCSLACPGYIGRRYTRIRYRQVPGTAAHSVRQFCMLPTGSINPRLLTECGRDKSSVNGAAVNLVVHCNMQEAQLDIHVKTSENEHIYYSNSTSRDGHSVHLRSPGGDHAASGVVSLLPQPGVAYTVWAYAYSFHDIFGIGATAELYTTHLSGGKVETRDVEIRFPHKFVSRKPRFWEIFSVDTTGKLTIINAAIHNESSFFAKEK